MVAVTGNSVGDTATYSCDLGFELIGGAITTCAELGMNSAAFLPAPPSCSREYTDYIFLKMAAYQVSVEWVNHIVTVACAFYTEKPKVHIHASMGGINL